MKAICHEPSGNVLLEINTPTGMHPEVIAITMQPGVVRAFMFGFEDSVNADKATGEPACHYHEVITVHADYRQALRVPDGKLLRPS